MAIINRPLKLPTAIPQFPNYKNGEKKNLFTRNVSLEFNMTMINTVENSVTKEQILSSERHTVRKTWSHTLNRKKKQLLIQYDVSHTVEVKM